MTAPTIELPPLASPVDELWHVLLDLGEQLTVGWTLVGGQMVLCTPSSTGGCLRRSARTGTSSPMSAPGRPRSMSRRRPRGCRLRTERSQRGRHRPPLLAAGRAEACRRRRPRRPRACPADSAAVGDGAAEPHYRGPWRYPGPGPRGDRHRGPRGPRRTCSPPTLHAADSSSRQPPRASTTNRPGTFATLPAVRAGRGPVRDALAAHPEGHASAAAGHRPPRPRAPGVGAGARGHRSNGQATLAIWCGLTEDLEDGPRDASRKINVTHSRQRRKL